MKRITTTLAAISIAMVITIPVLAVQPVMVTICHAAGRADTTHFVTLTLPYNAVYGQAGHLNEDGTPQAGHEEDYEGPCNITTTSTTIDPTTTTTSTSSTSSTTTSSTTTSSTTTTVTTTPSSSTTTTPTTKPENTTTTSPSTTSSTSASNTVTPTTPTTKPTVLPFTGWTSDLQFGLGLALLAAGGVLVLSLKARNRA